MQDSLTWKFNKKINRRDTVVLTEGLQLTAEKLKLCGVSTKGGMSSWQDRICLACGPVLLLISFNFYKGHAKQSGLLS